MNNRQVEVYNQLFTLLNKIRDSQPGHPMFGPISEGLIRAPFESQRANGTSWKNFIRNIAMNPYRRPIKWGGNMCWMAKGHTLKITRTETGGKVTPLRSFKTTRFLAFLANPTPENWTYLSDERKQAALNHPFDHYCNRGEATDVRQNGYVCVNGIEHGKFSTREVNNSRKPCGPYGLRHRCPGHGPDKVHCVFTHEDGVIAVCRNSVAQLRSCNCEKCCF